MTSTLASCLEQDVPRRKKKKPVDEDKLYGQSLSDELSTLLAVHRTHALEKQRWGELNPFHFVEPFALAGPNAATEHLERRTKLGWPVYFDAHFWNAFPFGATNGGDYWLVQVEGGSSTFVYDHETGDLTRKTSSVEELVRKERKLSAAKKKKASAKKPSPLLDPIALYGRSYWLTTLLGGAEPDDLDRELQKNAPPFRAFATEKTLLATHPHLALYWLFAHMLLRNEEAFREAYVLTKSSKHAFVRSARELCKKLLEDANATAGALTQRWRAKVDEALARLEPKSLFEPSRRAAAKPAAPNDIQVAVSTLQKTAKGKPKDFQLAVELLAAFAKKGGSPGQSKWPKDWATLFAKPELGPLLISLFRRGQERHWTEPLASDWFIDPLFAIGGPAEMEALVAATTFPSHLRRKVELSKKLVASDDPRVEAFFARRYDDVTSGKLKGVDAEEVAELVYAIIERARRKDDEATLAKKLAAMMEASTDTVGYRIADIAVERGLRDVSAPIVAKLRRWFEDDTPVHYACQNSYFHLGGALASLSPALAAQHFEPMWQAYLKYGPWEKAETNANLVAIGTAVLVPLLGSTKKAKWLPIAKTFAGWLTPARLREQKEWTNSLLHLLRGFRLSGDSFAKTFARQHASFTDEGGESSKAIQNELSKILGR